MGIRMGITRERVDCRVTGRFYVFTCRWPRITFVVWPNLPRPAWYVTRGHLSTRKVAR